MSSFLLAAWWEPLIPVAVVVGTLILTSLQAAWRKGRQRTPSDTHEEFGRAADSEDWNTTRSPSSISRWQRQPGGSGSAPHVPRLPALPPSPWERELQRALGQARPAAPLEIPQESAPEVAFPQALPPILAEVSTSDPATLDTADVPTLPIPNLMAADAHVEHAATLQERVRAHFNRVDDSIGRARPQPIPTRNPSAHRISNASVRRLRGVSAARQAFVAAVVFGPPRSNL